MGQFLPVILLGAVVASLAVLLFWRRSQLRIPSQYRSLLVIGIVIVFVGMLLNGLERSGSNSEFDVLANSALLPGVAQASQLGGAALMVLGVIGWIVSSMATRSPEPSERPRTKPRSIHSAKQDVLQALLRSSPNGMMVLKPVRDKNEDIVDFECWLANPAAVQMLGQPHSRLTDEPLLELLPCLASTSLLEQVLTRHGSSSMATRSPEPSERPRTKPRSIHSAKQDVLQALLRSSPNGMMVLKPVRDKNEDIVDFECWLANPAAVQMLGQPHSRLTDEPLLELLPCLASTSLLEQVLTVLKTGLPLNEEREFTQDGTTRWYHIVAVRHVDGLAVTFADISERKNLEEDLRRAARHDALTGLPNRALFQERLDQAVYRARRVKDYKFAVLFLDFDRFKIVNDSLGHDVGDELLKSIADRLRASLRAIDTVTGDSELDGHLPARLGGDEFVILLDGIHEVQNAQIVAERLRKDLSSPHRIGGHIVTSTASIGVVTSDGSYDSADELMHDADTAMYRAKVEGRARCVVFNEQMKTEPIPEMALEQELRDTVAREAFLLQYQPVVSLKSGRIAGFEALVRWPHPQRGLLLPPDFIPLAENLGVIVPIGRWVLQEAAKTLDHWGRRVPAAAPLLVSVNISKQELLQPDLMHILPPLLEEHGLEPEALRLEIAESTCTDRPKEIVPILQGLKELGVMLAMDDFGTGGSSMSFLDKMPFDCIKIDECFFNKDRKLRDRAAMLQSIVELAHNLKMSVIAEGVETEDHISLLQALDCDYAQGWIFSESVSAEEAEHLLTRDAGMKLAG